MGPAVQGPLMHGLEGRRLVKIPLRPSRPSRDKREPSATATHAAASKPQLLSQAFSGVGGISRWTEDQFFT